MPVIVDRASVAAGTFTSAGDAQYEYCFAAGTLVLMADGSRKAIETIVPREDRTWSPPDYDAEGPAKECRVLEVYHNAPAPILQVHAGGQVIRTTFNHPFYVRGKGWTVAEKLQAGDQLHTHEGGWVRVDGTEDSGRVEPVFNLQVEASHTYFVAEGPADTAVLVHNDSSAQDAYLRNKAGQEAALGRALTPEEDDAAFYAAYGAQPRPTGRGARLQQNVFAKYGFCASCHGSADGKWVNVASGLDNRPIPADQLQAIQIANAVSANLSPYAEGGVKIVSSGLNAVAGVVAAPFSGGASLALLWFAADDFITGVRDIVDHQSTNSLTHDGIDNYAYKFGASDKTADKIGSWGDAGLRVLAGLGAWAASRPTAPAGSLEEANALQGRAQQLNGLRDPWMAQRGTTAVVNVQNVNTQAVETWIATESSGAMPDQWNGFLRDGEMFKVGSGHAEQTIVNALGDDWVITAGGSSRNICISTCKPLLEGKGLQLGGPTFRGMPDKTPYRMFWSEP